MLMFEFERENYLYLPSPKCKNIFKRNVFNIIKNREFSLQNVKINVRFFFTKLLAVQNIDNFSLSIQIHPLY